MGKAILIIYSDDDFGGAERRLIRIYNELGKKHEVELVIRGCTEQEFMPRLEKADCMIDAINKLTCFRSNIYCLSYLLSVKKLSNVHFFDLCGFNIIVAGLFRIKRISTLLTIAYQNFAYGLMDEHTKKKLAKLIDLSSKVDVLFPAARDHLPSISKNMDIHVTPGTFTRLDVFVPEQKERILLFAAARLEKDKNAELLVDACFLCQDNLKKRGYRVIVAGKGFEEEHLRSKIHRSNLDDIVEMPGTIKISDVIPKAEMFLCLDLIDNYPSQVIAEAVACGCALICTDVGYSRRCGSDEFSYFIENDKAILANTIEDFIKKEEAEKETMFLAARRFAEKHYSPDASREYFEGLIDWGDGS